MEIERILITGSLVEEMKEQIDPDLYSPSFRFLRENEVTTDDLQWADGYAAFKPTVNFDYYNLKWVHSFGAGVDGYLFRKKWKENVLLTRTVCSFGQRISQYCLSYVLQDLQKHRAFADKQSWRQWQQATPDLLADQRILIYGTGEIGRETAALFSRFGLEVYGVSRNGGPQPSFHKVYPVFSEREIFPEVDIVINTLPLTEQTYQLFGKGIFHQLNEALFINVGRGASVNETDLIEALAQNNLRRAVLDVMEKEPLPVKNPFWNHEKITVTPHVSAVTTPGEAARCFLDTLKNIQTNQPLPNQVNPLNGY